DDRADTPAMLVRYLTVHPGIERRIDHGGIAVRADEIREAALPGAAQLHDARGAPGARNLRGVPGQTPGAHPALERHRVEAARPQALGSQHARLPSGAHGHDAAAVVGMEVLEDGRVTAPQPIVRVDVDAAGNRPL